VQTCALPIYPARFHPDAGFGKFLYIPGQGDETSAYAALASGEGVLVANTMRDRYGVESGDTVSLRTATGFEDFPVAAVVVDFTGGGEAIIGSIDRMGDFGGGSADLYVLTVEAAPSPEQLRANLLAAFPDLYLDATLNADYRSNILDITDQAFATTRVLLAIAVLVAVLGVANALGMNLVNRGH